LHCVVLMSLGSWRWFRAILASFTFWRLTSPEEKRSSLGEANRQKVKFAKMALNHLQEPRDIKIRQWKHKVSHFIQMWLNII